jgi:hypothetical protein
VDQLPYTKNEKIKQFLSNYRNALRNNYEWAREDEDKLKRLLAACHNAIEFGGNSWIPSGPAYAEACRDCGFDNSITLKAMRIWVSKL